ncbi:unnamed protein product, partial [Mesorhabditis spiculigera]
MGLLLKLALLVVAASAFKRGPAQRHRRDTSTFCGIADLSTLLMDDCPDASTLPLAGLNGTCLTGPDLLASEDDNWSIACTTPDSRMVIYGPSWSNNTHGYTYADYLFCNDDGTSIGSSMDYWITTSKFVPGLDHVACYQSASAQNEALFHKSTCDVSRFTLMQNWTTCPDFSTLEYYYPRTATTEPINATEAAKLQMSCETNYLTSYFYPRQILTAFPYSSYFCASGRTFMIRDNHVIPLRIILCESTHWTAVTNDNVRFTINTTTDSIFCTLPTQMVGKPVTCHDVIPANDCPSNITEYTSDLMLIPYSMPGLVPANPQCLQNYTIWYRDPNNGVSNPPSSFLIRCYQPGTDLNSPTRANSRMLILVEDHGKYHLTRTLGCGPTKFTLDEQYTIGISPEARFTCVDSLTAYDAMMTANGYDPSNWDWNA